MRLIDADALRKLWCENCDNKHFCNKEIYCDSVEQLYEQPTVDAVEVVRCKDCKWGREVCGNIECSADLNLPPEYHGYEWYCPNGERREDAGE